MSQINASTFTGMNRRLYRAAIDQGWIIKMTMSGHFRFIPPKGQSVIMSNTESAFKPNLRKLENAGLIVGASIEKETKVDIPKEVVQAIATPPIPPVAEKKPRGALVHAIRSILGANPTTAYDGSMMSSELNARGFGTTAGQAGIFMAGEAATGRARRISKGFYQAPLHNPDEQPVIHAAQKALKKANGAKPPDDMLPEDNEVIDQFMEALAKLQAWAQKMRERSAKFNELKKLLGGMGE